MAEEKGLDVTSSHKNIRIKTNCWITIDKNDWNLAKKTKNKKQLTSKDKEEATRRQHQGCNCKIIESHTRQMPACMHAQSCPTLCNSMCGSPPSPSVHGIFQTRRQEWIAVSFSRGSSWPRNWTCISYVSCIGRQILYQLSHWGGWPSIWKIIISQMFSHSSDSSETHVSLPSLGIYHWDEEPLEHLA